MKEQVKSEKPRRPWTRLNTERKNKYNMGAHERKNVGART